MNKPVQTKIHGKIIVETEKAVLIRFRSGRENWIPKSTIHSEFSSDKKIIQPFLIDTWLLEKNNIVFDEDLLVKNLINQLVDIHSDNLISIYGIGSFFDKNLPELWLKNDIDLIMIVKSIEDIPKEKWDKRFYSRNVEGFQVFIGYNTLEMYQNKVTFKKFSGANHEWALLELKNPENSTLLYGEDIRSKLPDITTLDFDYDDILARGLYHLEKSLKEIKDTKKAMAELTKAIFKVSFYLCVYFSETFRSTSLIEIERKLNDISSIVTSIKKANDFFEEAKNFRVEGKFKTDFLALQHDLILFVIDMLKKGVLHRKMDDEELRLYFTTYFGGFPLLQKF
ncbi:MAG: hypothetical protein ACFFFT_00255 [Candidatus Thorarchaeota archaeon]